jgi:cytochrome b
MSEPSGIKVWDPLVRVGHWTLVAAFFTAWFSEDLLGLHVWAGYVVLAVAAVRVAWGFIGTRYARFSDFVRPPRAVWRNLRDIALMRPEHFAGHSPAGGAMVVALLLGLAATCVTGVALYGTAEGAGPLAGAMSGASGRIEHWLEETHEFFANLTLWLVALHVVGVVLASFTHRENLVRSMLNGRKKIPDATSRRG